MKTTGPDARISQLESRAELALSSEDERRRFRSLPEPRRMKAMRRLCVALDRRSPPNERVFPTDASAAEYLGISTDRLYRLRHALAEPSLEALGIEVVSRGGNPAKQGRREEVAAEARRLLEADPAMRTGALLRMLVEGSGIGLSRPMLMSIVDEVRPGIPPIAAFGRFAFDSVMMTPSAKHPSDLRLYALVETMTGMILAGWMGSGFGLRSGYRRAACLLLDRASGRPDRHAGGTLRSFPTAEDVACSYRDGFAGYAVGAEDLAGLATSGDDIHVEVAQPGGFPAFVDRDLEPWEAGGWDMVTDERRLGRRIVAAVGRSLGEARLLTGVARGALAHATLDDDVAGRMAETVIDGLMTHNANRLVLARRGDDDAAAMRMALRVADKAVVKASF